GLRGGMHREEAQLRAGATSLVLPVAAGVAAAQQGPVLLEDEQGHGRVSEHRVELARIGAGAGDEVLLGGPASGSAIGGLDQVDELGDVGLVGGAEGGHVRILPARWSAASRPCPSGAARVSGEPRRCAAEPRGRSEPWARSCSDSVSWRISTSSTRSGWRCENSA